MRHTTYIYTLSDPISGEVRYIGKSDNLRKRYNHHVAATTRTHRSNWILSLKKKGLKPIMEIIDEVPIDEWGYWETFYIELLRSWGFRLTNHTTGGEGGNGTYRYGKDNPLFGIPRSEETKRKISDSHKGVKLSDEHRKALSKARRNVVYTEERCNNISKALKGKPKPEGFGDNLRTIKGTSVEIDGVHYDSINEAMRTLRMAHTTITKRVYSSKYENYKLVEKLTELEVNMEKRKQ